MNKADLIAGLRDDAADAKSIAANPPAGWFAFGTHVDTPGPLEFYGEEFTEDGLPMWERPVVTPTEADREVGLKVLDEWSKRKTTPETARTPNDDQIVDAFIAAGFRRATQPEQVTEARAVDIANRAQEVTGRSIWPSTVRAVLEAAAAVTPEREKR